MRLFTLAAFLLSALAMAAPDEVRSTSATPSQDQPSPTSQQPTETPMNPIELRQVVGAGGVAQPVATTAVSQANAVTTYEIDVFLDGATTPTYMAVVYTQTFASVPDQWTTAGAGSIGLGTITRSSTATSTAAAERKRSTSAASRGRSGLSMVAVGLLGGVVGISLL